MAKYSYEFKMQIVQEYLQGRVIGQNVLVKTAATIEISMDAAVISFFREDIRWTKRVGKILGIC